MSKVYSEQSADCIPGMWSYAEVAEIDRRPKAQIEDPLCTLVGSPAHASAQGHAEHRQPGAQSYAVRRKVGGRSGASHLYLGVIGCASRSPCHRLPPINIQVCALTFTLNISQIDSNVHSDDSP
ncbi:hypothetical protein HAX54_022307 [Datura stramonium]|uniref:Uncharacterized protein n=1 Tax=Datura stramonium TaxID=4076 RepID=A0ABS8UU06_DATST|nr:hypothetical protein [Datura stramonium]